MNVCDDNIRKLMDKFEISERKTYEPSLFFDMLSDNRLVSAFAGFIDGDGCINYQHGRKDCMLRIKIHSNWKKNLQNTVTRISDISGFKLPKVRINNQGYCNWGTGNNEFLRWYKKKLVKLKLPILARKWDKVDLSAKSAYIIAEERLVLAKEYRNLSNKDLAKKLKVTEIWVYILRKKHEF